MHVVATAGHVDHGKSTLVRALTGMEPDRWAEERRRGMTIDLGFAWTMLPPGDQLAFVDVPGHERFVPNMLAGVGPVPAALLVVAADEGWMPQTAEHVAALDALDVRHAVVAVTRSDLADPAPVADDVRRRLAGTSLGAGGVPAVAVCAPTGRGLDELVETGRIGTAIKVGVRSDEGPPELEQDLLPDPAGLHQEDLPGHRLDDCRQQHQPHDRQQHLAAAAGPHGRDAAVDPDLDQVGD